MNSKHESNESLCEKSMQVVINTIKLSYFSIAKMCLQTAGNTSARKNPGSSSIKAATSSSLSRFPQSLRSQEPQNSSQTVSYLLEPVGGKSVTREEKTVDGMTSDYIRKVYEKIHRDTNEMADLPPYVPSPSTRAMT